MQRTVVAAMRLLALLLAALPLVACGEDADPAVQPPATVIRTTTPATATPRAYRRVDLPDTGLSVMVPAGWEQDAGATEWHPAAGDPRTLGVRVLTPASATDLAALLPEGIITAQTPVALGWGSGIRFALRTSRGVEAHVMVPIGVRRVVNAFITAPGVMELSTIQADLDRLLGGVVLRAGGPFSGASSVPADPVTAATEAALVHFAAESGPGCARPGAGTRLCLTLQSTPDQVTRGIARFAAYNPTTTEGFSVVMGRDLAGAWHLWVQSAASTYQAFDLPVRLRACVGRLTVRSEPNDRAAPGTTYQQGTELNTAELFVLTEPASVSPPRSGAGWYKLSGDGWVYSREVTAATRADCSLRDEWER